MQNQQAAHESLLTVAQIPPLDGGLVTIIVILLDAVLLIAVFYLVYKVRQRPGVGSTTVPQRELSWLDYGSLVVVICGIGAAMIGFLLTLVFLGSFDDVTQGLGFMTAFFGAVIGLAGTYFGIKTSSDATRGAQQLAAASGARDTTPPLVLSIDPRDQAPDVPPDIHPTATFSKEMDPASINPNTFKLFDPATLQPVPGSVAYDETTRVATFTPAAALQNGRTYAATITANVKDKAGNTLAEDETWHFTVAAGQEA
jgi:Bacterial Ig-like domain